MEEILRQAGQRTLDLAHKKGVQAEAFLLYSKELSIDVSNGQVETLKEAEEMGLGLRVFNRGKMGFAYTSDLSVKALEEVVGNAVSISSYTASDEFNRFPAGGYIYPNMQIYDDMINTTTLESKIEMACEVENAARTYDKRVKLVEKAGYEDSEFSSLIMNSNGLYAFGKGNYCGIYIFVVAEENEESQDGFSVMVNKKIGKLSPQAVGEEGARRALRSLGARAVPSARIPCIMEPYVVTRFMSVLSQSVGADSVQKGKSMFENKLGQTVASGVVNLIDDASCAEGIASFPFDGEGVPAQKNVVIENGILKDYIYDSYSGLKAGKKSTGNGQRGSFRSLPSVGTSNFILRAGQHDPDKLMRDIEKGLYITDVMGMHTANPISGDFSIGAAGIMIENGQLGYPVRGITIAGNLGHFLKDIEAVGNDLRYYGGKAAPTIRLQSISVGGE